MAVVLLQKFYSRGELHENIATVTKGICHEFRSSVVCYIHVKSPAVESVLLSDIYREILLFEWITKASMLKIVIFTIEKVEILESSDMKIRQKLENKI